MTVGELVDLDALLVACWCEKSYVWVPRAEVRACRTRSCGGRDCRQEVAA